MPKKLNKKEQLRQERQDLHDNRDVLESSPKEGWTRRIVNEANLEKRLRFGWTHVEEDESLGDDTENLSTGSGTVVAVGTDEYNKPIMGYLMEIPTEKYEMDQAIKQEEDDKIMLSINKGNERIGTFSHLKGS